MPNIFAEMTSWNVLSVQGPDAKDYLHRITTTNFKFLRPGQTAESLLLQANGKIILYGFFHCATANNYLFWTPYPAQEAFDGLEKMHFREDFSIKILPLKSVRILGTTSSAPPLLDKLRELGSVLDCARWGESDLGILVSPERSVALGELLEQNGFTRSADQLEAKRIRNGFPMYPGEIHAQAMPLEIRLEGAVHENKGCYPGQEVIERVRSMGQAAKKLVRVEGAGAAPQSGIKITIGGETTTITSVAPDHVSMQGPTWVALASVRRASLGDQTQYSAALESGATAQCIVL